MKNLKLALATTSLLAALSLLQGCVPAVIATGATVGVMSAQDRRTTGAQTEDEGVSTVSERRMRYLLRITSGAP